MELFTAVARCSILVGIILFYTVYNDLSLDGCTTNDARSIDKQIFPLGPSICSHMRGELGVVTDLSAIGSHAIYDFIGFAIRAWYRYLRSAGAPFAVSPPPCLVRLSTQSSASPLAWQAVLPIKCGDLSISWIHFESRTQIWFESPIRHAWWKHGLLDGYGIG